MHDAKNKDLLVYLSTYCMTAGKLYTVFGLNSAMLQVLVKLGK